MNEEPPAKNSNNHTTALAKLLNQLNIPTLVAVTLMGGGNFFATKTTSSEQKDELSKALKEVHELHSALNAFESRQHESLENQGQLLRNQTTMLANQMQVLQRIRPGAEK